MPHYASHDDLGLLGELSRLAPDEMRGFAALDRIVGREGGEIPPKYRELIALGVALTTQCPYCLDVHTANAKKAGATEAELAETVFIAAALRAGAAVTHGAMAMKLFRGEA